MYKVKSFLQLIFEDDDPVVDQINDFLKDNPKAIPIDVSYGISTTDNGMCFASHAMILYKEEE